MRDVTDFWFQKGGVGGLVALRPLARCSVRNARRRPLSSSFHLSSFAMRWTVPVPMPSDLATFKIPMPFASCFRTLRSVVVSIFGHDEDHSGPDFGSRHARRNRPGFRTGPPVRMTSDTAGSASAAAAESLPSVRVFRPHDQPAALLVNSGTMEEACATKEKPRRKDGAVHQGTNPREAAKQPVVVVVYSICLWLQDKVPTAEQKVPLRGRHRGDRTARTAGPRPSSARPRPRWSDGPK